MANETTDTTDEPIARNGERTRVIVARMEGSPEITVVVKREGIAIALDIGDFVYAVLAKLEAPSSVFPSTRQRQLGERVRAAVAATVQQMKDESLRVV